MPSVSCPVWSAVRSAFVALKFGNVDVADVLVAVKYGAITALFEERLLTASVPTLKVPVTVRSPVIVVVARLDVPVTPRLVADALPSDEFVDVSVERVAVPLEIVTFVSVAPSLFTPPVLPLVELFELLPPPRLFFSDALMLSFTNGRTTASTASLNALPTIAPGK